MRELIDLAGLTQIGLDGAKTVLPAVRTRARLLGDPEVMLVVRLLEEHVLEADLLVRRLVELTVRHADEAELEL